MYVIGYSQDNKKYTCVNAIHTYTMRQIRRRLPPLVMVKYSTVLGYVFSSASPLLSDFRKGLMTENLSRIVAVFSVQS
jgi:hypothetical protein